MSVPGVSDRTVIRDAIVHALTNLKGQSTARTKDFEVRLQYLTEQEMKQATTYCVVMTDESGSAQTLQQMNWDLTALVVIYVNDTRDPRAKLDACIEDVYETLLLVQGVIKEMTAWKVMLGGIKTDEGTTAAGPIAQAVMSWVVSHRRKITA